MIILVEESKEGNKKLYLLFIDFEKAFDSVDRDRLWRSLKYYGIPERIVDMILAFYEELECCVKTENGTTRFFKIVSGVREGCVQSRMLFIIIMDYALRFASGYGVKLSNKQLFDLDLSDDVVLLKEYKERLRQPLDTITKNAEKLGLNINIDKSKSMDITSSPLVLHCKNKNLEQFQEFKYQGSWIHFDGNISTEIKRRIGQATGAFNRLSLFG